MAMPSKFKVAKTRAMLGQKMQGMGGGPSPMPLPMKKPVKKMKKMPPPMMGGY